MAELAKSMDELGNLGKAHWLRYSGPLCRSWYDLKTKMNCLEAFLTSNARALHTIGASMDHFPQELAWEGVGSLMLSCSEERKQELFFFSEAIVTQLCSYILKKCPTMTTLRNPELLTDVKLQDEVKARALEYYPEY